MNKPKFYKAVQIRNLAGVVFDYKGDEIDPEARGLSEPTCRNYDDEPVGCHSWLILPAQQGHKEYIRCIVCGEYSHL